jgi:hypothetical protein
MIPAKEKADELIREFSVLLPFYSPKDNLAKSKKCALKSVEQILSATHQIHNVYYYYLEVQKEIEKP